MSCWLSLMRSVTITMHEDAHTYMHKFSDQTWYELILIIKTANTPQQNIFNSDIFI